MMTEKPTETPGRYTSYHSEDTYSIFDTVWGNFKRKQGFNFEYNGLLYSVSYHPTENRWTLYSHEPKYEYLMPWSESRTGAVTEFSDDAVDEFITTFEIEGKTIEWIIKNQREWKYKFSAEHFERILTGFSFCFVYRKMPCLIYHYRGDHRSGPNPDDPFVDGGRHISIRIDTHFDPTQYAPSRPGEKPWYKAVDQFWSGDSGTYDTTEVHTIKIGPFKTDGELLDTVRFNGKTLRELFDTEYDDREVLCGDFDG